MVCFFSSPSLPPLFFFFFPYQEIGKPNVHISLVPTKPGFGQCCLAAHAMPRVTQFQLRAFFKAEHHWAKKSLEKEAVTSDKTPRISPISLFPCLNILFRFSHTSWRQRKKQNMEHLAVM